VTERLRFLRRDTEGHSERELSDARLVAEHVRRRTLDPEVSRRIKLRRRTLVLGLAGICLAGSVAAFIGEGGYVDMLRLRHEISLLKADIERREAAVARLAGEVRRLEIDPVARERVAREELGLVRPGEIDFLLPREHARVWEPPPSTIGSAGRRP
jgi:cell division protein FtsB